MPLTFDAARDDIARLVRHYSLNRAHYRSPGYKEAQARSEFIDKFFEALGWDVRNTEQAAPRFREVVVEDSLEIEGQRKAPDYAFRMGDSLLFYVEAKKPGVDLKNDPTPAYQLRRYGWSGKLALSLLTDFEELAVYDCRPRPAPKDKTGVARLNYYTAEQYPDRWRELWDTFSREAVRAGSFDQFVETAKGKRGAATVDAEFLKEIEGWRDVLARNFALRNPRLSIDDLNDAVQRLIDRIIFLRMAEDRGIEEYGRLQRLAEKDNVFKRLTELSRAADERYNSGLFDRNAPHGKALERLSVDDKVLKPILAGLYYPESPYEFSVLPVELLGNVYEQFLGKVIRLTPGHQAKVEEKPEVKKAGGVYYTPAYIVEYIVRNTVGKLAEGKGPKELKGLRVLDPACGSGSFLLGAYQFLLDHYTAWYAANEPQKHKAAVQQTAEGWALTLDERKRILTEHLFGVDLDRQAVEVTKLSLLLKVLEGVKQLGLLTERLLPNLDDNIKCGNSLIGPDYFAGQLLPDDDELRRVNAFDWQRAFPDAMRAGGFDAVIGNPPYIRIQTLKEWAPLEVEAYKEKYAAAGSGNYDIYVVFVEKALSLLNARGRLGFILPHKFFNAQYGAPLRGLVARGGHLAEVIHFGDQQVFAGATTYTCLLFLTRQPNDAVRVSKVTDLTAWRTSGAATQGQVAASAVSEAEWNFAVGAGAALFEKLRQMPVKLVDVAERMYQGPITSADTVYLFKDLWPRKKRSIAEVFSKELDEWVSIEAAILKPVVRSGDIRRYTAVATAWVLFPYEVKNNAARLLTPTEMQRDHPFAWEYLNRNRKLLESREKGAFKDAQWYRFGRNQNLGMWEQPKLLIPYMITELAAYWDAADNYYFVNVTTGGYGITLDERQLSYAYLCGLLNSRLLDFYFKQVSTNFHSGYFAANKQYIDQLPIRLINFSDPADKARHDRMVTLVEKMLDLHKRKAAAGAAEAERLQRLIADTDAQIDALVYELYGLSAEEIAVVEGRP